MCSITRYIKNRCGTTVFGNKKHFKLNNYGSDPKCFSIFTTIIINVNESFHNKTAYGIKNLIFGNNIRVLLYNSSYIFTRIFIFVNHKQYRL